MPTKEKILTTALALFNQHGVDAVTTRHVAAEMGISHGNLCYHYPRKEEIIEQLYQRLVQELDDQIRQVQAVPSLERLFELTEATFAVQYRYRFLLLHMVDIMRRIDSIRLHFRQLLHHRKAQFGSIIQYFVQQGIFKEEFWPDQYQYLVAHFYIIGDFWLSEAELLYEGVEPEKVAFYARIAHAMIVPYLTPAGLAAYQSLRDRG